MNIIETNHLHFSYGKYPVLKDISVRVPENSIYGLLGRNGSGKSTTLKLILNLLPSKVNEILLWGESNLRYQNFSRIGCLIESPAFYGYMTVEEHLRMFDILFRRGEAAIGETLELTGLTAERYKKAARLSTGLKQRLGIAMALFRNPELLILDEPTNGLDPIGIIDIRHLIQNLQQEGKTILLSSHIIPEMEKICTHIGIIENGELKFQGPLTEDQQPLEDFYLSMVKN